MSPEEIYANCRESVQLKCPGVDTDTKTFFSVTWYKVRKPFQPFSGQKCCLIHVHTILFFDCFNSSTTRQSMALSGGVKAMKKHIIINLIGWPALERITVWCSLTCHQKTRATMSVRSVQTSGVKIRIIGST